MDNQGNTYNMNKIEAHQARERRLLLTAAAAGGATVALLNGALGWAITVGLTGAGTALGMRAARRNGGTSGPGETTDDVLTSVAAMCSGVRRRRDRLSRRAARVRRLGHARMPSGDARELNRLQTQRTGRNRHRPGRESQRERVLEPGLQAGRARRRGDGGTTLHCCGR